MTSDCIIFEINKKPYVDQVDPSKQSVSFGVNAQGNGIWRRIGTHSMTLDTKQESYLYVSEHAEPPTKSEIENAIRILKPTPYETE